MSSPHLPLSHQTLTKLCHTMFTTSYKNGVARRTNVIETCGGMNGGKGGSSLAFKGMQKTKLCWFLHLPLCIYIHAVPLQISLPPKNHKHFFPFLL